MHILKDVLANHDWICDTFTEISSDVKLQMAVKMVEIQAYQEANGLYNNSPSAPERIATELGNISSSLSELAGANILPEPR